jgi:hypothetical protein
MSAVQSAAASCGMSRFRVSTAAWRRNSLIRMAKVLHVYGEYSLNKAAMPFDFSGEQTFHKK